jgi:hypothetical protein
VDFALLQWFNQKRAEGTSVSCPMHAPKAKFCHEALGLKGEFNASAAWLARFKQQYGIHEIAVQQCSMCVCVCARAHVHVHVMTSNYKR